MLVCPGYVKTGFQEHVRGDACRPMCCAAAATPSPRRQCAVAIRRGVERGARTVLTPRAGWILVALGRLFPATVQARMAGMNESA